MEKRWTSSPHAMSIFIHMHRWSHLRPHTFLTVFIPCSIGGTPEFISDALTNELAARVVQDSKNQCTQSWHVVVFPDSNMSNAPISHLYRGSEATERYALATNLRPSHQNSQNNQNALVSQQSRQNDRPATFVQGNPYNGHQALVPRDQQPMHIQNSAMGGCGWGGPSVSRSQQSQFTTPMPGIFSNRDGSTMLFPQEQLYSQAHRQGSSQGFGSISGPFQSNYQGQSNMMFNQNGALPMECLPQVHRPVFDKYGYIIGEEVNMSDGNMSGCGGNLHNDDMYRTSGCNTSGPALPIPFQGPQQQPDLQQQVQDTEMRNPHQVQNTEMGDPQLAAAAQSFYSFVTNNLDQDDVDQVDDYQGDGDSEEEENQDEGTASRKSSGKSAIVSNGQKAHTNQPESPPTEVLQASEKEPHRFVDKTGTGLCDYCGRDGHEADVCIKWDMYHYDKPVCTACNNDQHSLDECPKFRAMTTPEKQTLLLGKGGRRPGVRSEYYAWTSYVHLDGYKSSNGGLPLTRRFLFNLSVKNHGIGAAPQNIWKSWDYERGVPDQFLDPRAESLAGDPAAPVDERFMAGKHELGWKIHPRVHVEDENDVL